MRWLVVVLALAACKDKKPAPAVKDAAPLAADAGAPADAAGAVELPPAPPLPERHRGLPRLSWGSRAPTPERVALGRLLFSEESVYRTGSCARCHDPERGFASAEALPETAAGKTNLRNPPALFDLGYQKRFYRDARADSIEALLPGHIIGQLGADLAEIAVRLATDRRWRAHFSRAFEAAPTPENVAVALADYARTRFSPLTPWDRHEAGEAGAVSAAAIRGAAVFNQRAGCAVCHPPPLYTDLETHPTSVPETVGPPDPGRGRLTDDPQDHRAFKTPSLRGLALTAPYFHAGTSATLAEAIDVELRRVDAGLTAAERADLLAFLQALSPPGP